MKNKIEAKVRGYKKIKPPKFQIGRLILNEYELRNIQLEIVKGEREGNIIIYSIHDDTWHTLDNKGNFNCAPKSLAIMSQFTLQIIKTRKDEKAI